LCISKGIWVHFWLFIVPVPPGHVACKTVLGFEKLPAMEASLRLGRKVGLYVGEQVILSLPNLSTNDAFEQLMSLLEKFRHKVFWFSFVQAWKAIYVSFT
jgi:hypothetical protein